MRNSAVLDKLDHVSPKVILIINLVLGLFVLIAHSGALALITLGKAPEFERYKIVLLVSVVISTFVVVSSIYSFIRSSKREGVLKLHAIVFLPGALLLLGWGAKLVLRGLPSGVNFYWTPGLYTALVFYAVYLFRRTFLRGYASESNVVKHCHVWAGVVALALEVGVLVRIVLQFRSFFGGPGTAL